MLLHLQEFTCHSSAKSETSSPKKRKLTMMWFVGFLNCHSHLTSLQADAALLRLPAPGLRGTWARAYALLTRLVSDIGWDELLKTRSAVFVMEEEYRMQKAQVDIQKVVTPNGARSDRVILEDSSVTGSTTLADDDASTRGVSSPLSESESRPELENGLNASGGIPTILVSSDSDTEREIAESIASSVVGNGVVKEDEVTESASMQSPALEKPMQAAGEEPEPQSPNANQEAFSFTNKRLCERWLDNLFMVLYEVRIHYLRSI